MTETKASSPAGGYRLYVLAVLILVYTFNFLDRQILGILKDPIQDELGLTDEDTLPSWNILRECGNQSSASVLFVLDEWLRTRQLPSGAYGMLAAFGPGFSAETALLAWD